MFLAAQLVAAGVPSAAEASRGWHGAAATISSQDVDGGILQRGIDALRSGDAEGAITTLQRAVELAPDSAEAHYWLGIAHLDAGHPGEAAAVLLDAERLAPRFDTRISYQLGVALMRAGRFDEASGRFEQVDAHDPGSPLPRLNLGWIAMQRDQAERALELFEAVIADHPDSANAYYFAGRVHEGLADFEAARAAYRRAVAVSATFVDALLALGNLALIEGDLSSARVRFEHALEAQPRSAAVHAKLGELAMREGALDLAIDRLEAALSIDPGLQAARYNLGLVYTRAGRADEAGAALARFDQALSNAAETEREARRRSTETRAEALIRRARSGIADGQWQAAIDTLEQVTVLAPTEVQAWELLVRAYEAVGDTAKRDHARRQVALLRRPPA